MPTTTTTTTMSIPAPAAVVAALAAAENHHPPPPKNHNINKLRFSKNNNNNYNSNCHKSKKKLRPRLIPHHCHPRLIRVPPIPCDGNVPLWHRHLSSPPQRPRRWYPTVQPNGCVVRVSKMPFLHRNHHPPCRRHHRHPPRRMNSNCFCNKCNPSNPLKYSLTPFCPNKQPRVPNQPRENPYHPNNFTKPIKRVTKDNNNNKSLI